MQTAQLSNLPGTSLHKNVHKHTDQTDNRVMLYDEQKHLYLLSAFVSQIKSNCWDTDSDSVFVY